MASEQGHWVTLDDGRKVFIKEDLIDKQYREIEKFEKLRKELNENRVDLPQTTPKVFDAQSAKDAIMRSNIQWQSGFAQPTEEETRKLRERLADPNWIGGMTIGKVSTSKSKPTKKDFEDVIGISEADLMNALQTLHPGMDIKISYKHHKKDKYSRVFATPAYTAWHVDIKRPQNPDGMVTNNSNQFSLNDENMSGSKRLTIDDYSQALLTKETSDDPKEVTKAKRTISAYKKQQKEAMKMGDPTTVTAAEYGFAKNADGNYSNGRFIIKKNARGEFNIYSMDGTFIMDAPAFRLACVRAWGMR